MQRNGKLPHTAAAILEMPAASPEMTAASPEMTAASLEVRAASPEMWAASPEMTAASPEMTAASPEVWAGSPEMTAAESTAAARSRKNRRPAYLVKGSVEQRLLVAKIAIEAVLNDPALQELLAPYGYATAELRQGHGLRVQALALVQQQQARVGKQFAATDSRINLQAQVHATYRRHVALARIALRDDRNATQALDLSARKGTLAGWVLQAQQFYTNALADQAILAKLAHYSVTKEQMLAAQALVEEVANAIVAQQSSKGFAQESKRARDAALHALDRWMLDFIAVARIALAGQPQRLAQLGLVRG